MIMFTTHTLNYVSLAALCRDANSAPESCPFCHGSLPDCDCGFGRLKLDGNSGAGNSATEKGK